MKKPLCFLSVLLISVHAFGSAAFAASPDLTSSDPKVSHFIKVTARGQQRKFEYCQKGGGCRHLGLREWYAVDELQDQRTIEQWQAAGSIVGTVGIAIAAFFGSASAGVFLLPLETTASANALSALWVGGWVAGTAGGFSLTDLGPSEQLKQQYLLRDELIDDHAIVLDDADEDKIRAIARRLETVLGKL